MYDVLRPTKIALYINNACKSAPAIQRELGCSHLINGGLFDGAYKPCCWLRAEGRTLSTENWSDYGFGWDDNKLVMDLSPNITKYRNFISCVAMVKDKAPLDMICPAAMGGWRGRTAIATMPDGAVLTFCTQDGTKEVYTPEELQGVMLSMGVVDALMLDGGISSHCIMPKGSIPPNPKRPFVHNYIALWTGEVEEKPNSYKPVCPYAEPTRNIRWGSIGEGAKWVQWQLTRNGIFCAVDGLFFGGSVDALKAFQVAHGLVADGVCGHLTREELKT